MSLENRLNEIASIRPEFNVLWSTWNLNKNTIASIISNIIKDYPHYSMHDSSHSNTILSNIERILGDERVYKLTPTDLWLLLHVSYFHDFGMVITHSKEQDIWRESDFEEFMNEELHGFDKDTQKAASIISNVDDMLKQKCDFWPIEVKNAVTLLLSKYYRKYHSDMSKEYIINKDIWSLDLGHNGLIKNNLIYIIAEICSLHTKSFDEILKLPKKTNGFDSDYAHPRFIACMLRIGDVLDLDNGRFNNYAEKIFGKFPDESLAHYKKHESIKYLLVTPEIIEVEADCHDNKSYRETRIWFDTLKNEVTKLHLNWTDIVPKDFGSPPKLSKCDLLRDGIKDEYGLSELKLNISRSKALELLEGSFIYSSKLAFIREVIQNAEDASKIQLWRDINKGMYCCKNGIDRNKIDKNLITPMDIPSWVYDVYSISIVIESTDKDKVRLVVSDHGTGISVVSLKNICNIGQSYAARKEMKKEIESMPKWLRPTAGFGIGLQSCFMVADKFTIETKADSDEALDIMFESGKNQGYVNARIEKKQRYRGSRVIIELDKNISFTYSMLGRTAKVLRYSDPLEQNNSLQYRISEEIMNECTDSFFPISIIAEEINYKDKIKSLVITEQSKMSDGFCFDDNNMSLDAWQNNSFYHVELSQISQGSISVYFKGKLIKDARVNSISKGLNILVDLYGMKTKEALSLNRENLNYSAWNEVIKDMDNVIEKYFEMLTKRVESLANSLQEDFITKNELWLKYALCSLIYELEIPNHFIEVIPDYKVSVIKMIGENVKFDTEEFKKIYTDIKDGKENVAFIKMKIGEQYREASNYITKGQLTDDLKNNISYLKCKYIISDEYVCDYLTELKSNPQYLKSGNLTIYLINKNTIYDPDENTRNILIKQLVYTGLTKGITRNNLLVGRRAIPAIKPYNKLSVKKLPSGIYSDEIAKTYIISPISKKNSEKINELSCDKFVNYITNENTFEKLVDFIFENRVDDKVKKEEIIEEYKNLIENYYNIYKKEEKESEKDDN